jgi:hypothetical protein
MSRETTGKIFNEGVERNAVLLKYREEEVSADLLLLHSDDKKSWNFISAYPFIKMFFLFALHKA